MYCPNPECPDFVEDGRPGEYVDTVAVCPKCGASLVAEWPAVIDEPSADASAGRPGEGEAVAPAPPPEGLLVAVAAFDYPDEADAFASVLVAGGISAYQFFDDGRDFAASEGIAPCTRVLVPESQAQQASLLAERHRGED
jgi:hypothetical protein